MPAKIDLTGHKFGKLTAINEYGVKNKLTYWNCECDCGNTTIVTVAKLRNGHTSSCGCMRKVKRRQDLTGKKFGKLTVIRDSGKKKNGSVLWVCKCNCGIENEVLVKSIHLTKGITRSCGCIRWQYRKIDYTGKKNVNLHIIRKVGKDKQGNDEWFCKCDCGKYIVLNTPKVRYRKSCGCLNDGHRMRKHPLYSVWKDMNLRCKSNKPIHRTYREKNIVVCSQWVNDPISFINWAEKNGYEKGLQLDRIDNEGNYDPDNCRFVTVRENALNKTRINRNNTTGYIGVLRYGRKFSSKITRFGKAYHAGIFDSAKEAAEARDKYILENFPDDGYQLNFPIEYYSQ